MILALNYHTVLSFHLSCKTLVLQPRAQWWDERGQLPLYSFVPTAVSPLSPDPALVVSHRSGSFAGLTLLHLFCPHGCLALDSPQGTRRGGGGGALFAED